MANSSAENPAEYWGTLINDGQPSQMFLRLNLAIIEFARATTLQDTPAFPPDKAAPWLNFQHLLVLIPIFSTDSAKSLTDMLPKIPVNFHQRIAAILMESLAIPEVDALFTRKGCQSWMVGITRAYPDEIHSSLNKLLQGNNYLLDPLTEKRFVFKEIPRSCFPPSADLQRRQKYERLESQVESKMAPLVVEIQKALRNQAQSQPVASQQAQTLAHADHEAQRMRNVALHGEFYYDEQGRKRYKGGAFDSLNDANF